MGVLVAALAALGPPVAPFGLARAVVTAVLPDGALLPTGVSVSESIIAAVTGFCGGASAALASPFAGALAPAVPCDVRAGVPPLPLAARRSPAACEAEAGWDAEIGVPAAFGAGGEAAGGTP